MQVLTIPEGLRDKKHDIQGFRCSNVTTADLRWRPPAGDVLFIKGAYGEAFDVSIGASYENDRGMRKDSHDFFGVALSIPMSDKNPRGQKRQQVAAGGATEPVSKGRRQGFLKGRKTKKRGR